MEDKETAEILLRLLNNPDLSVKEREAVRTAIVNLSGAGKNPARWYNWTVGAINTRINCIK